MSPTSTLRLADTQAASFPVNGVLDDFNRANGSIGYDWGGVTQMFAINSQQLQPLQGGNAIYWDNPFGAEQEAYVTLSDVHWDADEVDLLLKSQSSSWTGGAVLEVYYDADNGLVQVWSYTTQQDWVQRGSDITVTFADGDRFGAVATASGQVKVYKNSTLLATVDITGWPYYTSGGYIGLWTIAANGMKLDDFGGGTAPQSYSPAHSLAALWAGIRGWFGGAKEADLVPLAVSLREPEVKLNQITTPPAGQEWHSYYYAGTQRVVTLVPARAAGAVQVCEFVRAWRRTCTTCMLTICPSLCSGCCARQHQPDHERERRGGE